MLLTRPDFLVSIFVGGLILVTFYYWLLLKVSTLETTLANISAEPFYKLSVLTLVPLVLLLFGLNFALSILLFRAKGGLRWQGSSLLGAFSGGFAAACPVCGAFLLSLIGVAGGLTVLPFAGLEIWTASALVMGLAFWGSLVALDRETCLPSVALSKEGDLKTVKKSCWKLPEVKHKRVALLVAVGLGLLVNFYSMLSQNDANLIALAKDKEINNDQEGVVAKNTDNKLFEEIKAEVLPKEGVTLPIRCQIKG